MNRTEAIQTIDNILTDEADYVVFAGEDRNTARPQAPSIVKHATCGLAVFLSSPANTT